MYRRLEVVRHVTLMLDCDFSIMLLRYCKIGFNRIKIIGNNLKINIDDLIANMKY